MPEIERNCSSGGKIKAPAWGFQNNAAAAFQVFILEKPLTIHLVRRRAYLNAVERVR